jgi:hypothetical protein
VLSLLANDPFPGTPPRWIRASYFEYEFASRGDPSHAWWKRRRIGEWLPSPPATRCCSRSRAHGLVLGYRAMTTLPITFVPGA